MTDFSVVFTKKNLWTSAVVPGIVVAKATKPQQGGNHTRKSVINKLYDSKIFPAETVVPATDDYRAATYKASKLMDELQEALTAEENKKLEDIIELNMGIIDMESRAIYAEGIRFGIELMIEINRMDEFTRH